MRLTVASLRRSIVVLSCVLVLVLAGFFYARYRYHHLLADLPAKLGASFQQTADGFTYSQSSKGHTLYTVHASKLFKYKTGGHATLHDVQITLYGAPGSNRTDKIYGSEFDYDEAAGIISAKGAVQIDLSGLNEDEKQASGASTASGKTAATDSGQKTIHVKTSGLIFNQKTGEAETQEHTEFALPKASGSSTGASYESKSGLLTLDKDVVLTTSNDGKQAVVHASHATLLRESKQAFLIQPVSVYDSETSSSEQAIVYFRKDGSAYRIEAQGHVKVTTGDGAIMTAGNSQTSLDAKSQPVQTDVGGGVNFVSKNGNETMNGTAVSCTLNYGPSSTLKHGQCRDAVSFVEQILKLANDPNGAASRQVQASKIDVDFVPGPDGKKSVPQKALGVGGAQVTLHTVPSRGGQQLTTVSGDQLLATLDGTGTAIKQLDGSGSTKIVDQAADGSVNTSSGDRLHMIFMPQPKAAKQTVAPGSFRENSAASVDTAAAGAGKPGRKDASQVETAIQDGHVVLIQTPVKKADAKTDPVPLNAWADHAEYHSADETLHLTGSPRLKDGDTLQMSAQKIDYFRDSGNASAQGTVKATYRQAPNGAAGAGMQLPSSGRGPDLGGSGPVFITADRGNLDHAANVSKFFGSATVPARMWQSDHSISAPVIEVAQNPQTLKAYGPAGSTAAVVSANLTSMLGAKHQQSVVRIHSRMMDYSDADRRGDFRGSVTAEDPDGVIHSDVAQVFLTAKEQGQKPSGSASQPAASAAPRDESQIDHIVATGNVVLTQAGRKATGDKLVYTSDDGKYVLTGSAASPPHVYDQVKGTTTGARLIFNSQDDSVVVSGGQSSAVTETRTPR